MLGPIFVREWRLLPRRPQHYRLRSAYVGLLLVLGMTTWQATIGWSRPATLGDVARLGQLLFRTLVFVQLIGLAFFAALTTASSISQEKDRRTFILLLLTDLRNHEIVLGKLLGNLLQIGLLVLAQVPVLTLLMLLGGVTFAQALQAFVLLAATCLAAGSLGGLVALWREQTFQALALTVVFLVLYWCGVQTLVLLPGEIGPRIQGWLDPLRCLEMLLAGTDTGTEEAGLPPVLGLALAMLGLSVVLNGWGILRLRVWNPSGEPIMQRERPEEQEAKDPAAHAAPGKARPVWANPILWREVQTRAYGRRLLLVKATYLLVIGLIGWSAFKIATGSPPVPFAAAYGLLPLTILGLLLVSLQAVTSITSERDKGALDLLLVTDLSPHEFIFGKIFGILFNAKEYLLPPFVLLGVYAWLGLLATPATTDRTVAALLCMLITYLILLAFVTVLGLHIGLRIEQSRLAITHTLGTVFFLSAGTLLCIYLILISGQFEYQWGSFLFFGVAGVGGLWWVLNGERPSTALNIAAWLCPFAVLYAVMNVVIGVPGSAVSSPPFLPALGIALAFGFTVWAMLAPLLGEFDVALGRTTGGPE